MACCAACEFFTVNIAVAGLAFRHELGPVLFVRVVRMIYRMTLHTIDLVLATLIFYLGERSVVTAGAFFGRQRLDVSIIG